MASTSSLFIGSARLLRLARLLSQSMAKKQIAKKHAVQNACFWVIAVMKMMVLVIFIRAAKKAVKQAVCATAIAMAVIAITVAAYLPRHRWAPPDRCALKF